jgi:hypothetical protein
MSNFKSEEIQSKSLNNYFNGEANDEKTDVVKLPEIKEEEPDYELEEDEKIPEEPEEPELFEDEKDICIPGLGKLEGKKNDKPKNSQSIFDGGRASYFLYGLMGLGLVSQLLK